MSLNRKRQREPQDIPRRPKLNRSIDELIDDSIRYADDIFVGKLSMVRDMPIEQADTAPLLDPTKSRRLFDKSALREQMLKRKNKRIATTTDSIAVPGEILPIPVKGERYTIPRDKAKESEIELQVAFDAFLDFTNVVRNDEAVEPLDNLDASNWPPIVRIAFLEKHPWRQQVIEFLRWFFNEVINPTEVPIEPYNELFDKLAEQLISLSDFPKEYMQLSQGFMYIISSLLGDYDEQQSILGLDQKQTISDLPDGEFMSEWETMFKPEDDIIADLERDPEIAEAIAALEGKTLPPLEESDVLYMPLHEIVRNVFNNRITLTPEETKTIVNRDQGFDTEEIIIAVQNLMYVIDITGDRVIRTDQKQSLDSLIDLMYLISERDEASEDAEELIETLIFIFEKYEVTPVDEYAAVKIPEDGEERKYRD